jgi:magnesium chelatase family protein
MNPCPCGYAGSAGQPCRCSPLQVRRYLAKVSGPLIDRIAIHVPVRAVDPRDFDDGPAGAGRSSAEMRAEVLGAVAAQRERYRAAPGIKRNADLPLSLFDEYCSMERDASDLLAAAQRRLLFSARARRNIVQVARTIADLDGSSAIAARHVAEAAQYRVPRLLEGG